MCPFCGHNLPYPIIRGISSCNNCERVFESSTYHYLLSAAWLVRRQHIGDKEILIQRYHCDSWVADLVIEFVARLCYSHEEFKEYLNKNNFNQNNCGQELCQGCKIHIDLAS